MRVSEDHMAGDNIRPLRLFRILSRFLNEMAATTRHRLTNSIVQELRTMIIIPESKVKSG
jgi:hypothetical protein